MLQWFRRLLTPVDPLEPTTVRLLKVELELKGLRLEWEDTYERVMTALARLNKRHRDQHRKELQAEAAEAAQEAPGATIEMFPGVDPISAKILARRARVPTRTDGAG